MRKVASSCGVVNGITPHHWLNPSAILEDEKTYPCAYPCGVLWKRYPVHERKARIAAAQRREAA